ncbi:MAG: hypothetical protein QXG39_01945 [Candidatus Aenigmatarchaeota archaeon]
MKSKNRPDIYKDIYVDSLLKKLETKEIKVHVRQFNMNNEEDRMEYEKLREQLLNPDTNIHLNERQFFYDKNGNAYIFVEWMEFIDKGGKDGADN